MSDPRGSGHVFVVQGDLTALACHDVVVPVDRQFNVTSAWTAITGQGEAVGPWFRVPNIERPTGWGDPVRVVRHHEAVDQRRIWLLDSARTGPADVDWLLAGIQSAITEIAKDNRDGLHPPPRARRLIGMPLFGVGDGGYGDQVGTVISKILSTLTQAVQVGVDVALVLPSRANFAAVQHVRRQHPPTALSPDNRKIAAKLAERAKSGDLAIFMGAGVSIAAGLPSWPELLTELAAGVPGTSADACKFVGG